MQGEINSDTTYHRTWLLVLLACGYSAIAFSIERTALKHRKEQKCPCSVGRHVIVVAATTFDDDLSKHPENNTCGLIIKHPIGDMERRVNHLGEYHE